jgi:hypothetical protein
MSDNVAAKKPSKVGKLLKTIGLAILGFFILLIVIGIFAGKDDKATNAASGDAATGDAAPVPELAVTAVELAKAYAKNEVSAQAKYGAKKLAITGTIDNITLDFANDPVVSFEGAEMFQSPQAAFTKADGEAIGKLEKGMTITVHCGGVGEVIGTPMLKDCTL